MRYVLMIFMLLIFRANAQEIAAGFSVKDSVCLEEIVSLENHTKNAEKYSWDFCLGDFQEVPSKIFEVNSSSFYGMTGYELINYEGQYYGFAVNWRNNLLIRIDFGDTPLNPNPNIVSLGNPGDLLSAPSGISMIKKGADWYGFVGYHSDGYQVVRLKFSGSITAIPTAEKIGDLGTNNRKKELKIVSQNGSYILVASDYGGKRLIAADLGQDLEGPILNIVYTPKLNYLVVANGFEIIEKDDNFIAYVFSIVDEEIAVLNFGNNLLSEPVVEDTMIISGFKGAYNLSIVNEANQDYAVFGGADGKLRVYELHDRFNNPTEVNYGTSLTKSEIVEAFRYNGETVVHAGANLYFSIFKFAATCQSSLSYSLEASPIGLNYNLSGTYEIWLETFDSLGNRNGYIDSIFVKNAAAPDISFTVDSSRCIDNQNTFTSSSTSGGIISYSWDFNNDGTEDNNEPNPSYQFGVAGTYPVNLKVSNADGCSNSANAQIKLYNQPPAPSFHISVDTACMKEQVELVIDQIPIGYDNVLTYHWVNSEIEPDPSNGSINLEFETTGNKKIAVYSAIPGCVSSEVLDSVFIKPVPTISFKADTVCNGDFTTFNNDSEGISFTWDFGDGVFSNQASPKHLYTNYGKYPVKLTAEDKFGCANVSLDTAVVGAAPVANFENPWVCQGDSIQLMDVSTVDGGDIVSWHWKMGDFISEEKAPKIVFSESGKQDVILTVTSSEGCEGEITKAWDVVAQPSVAIEAADVCLGQSMSIVNKSPNQSFLSKWWWQIDGEPVAFNSKVSFDYLFETAGNHTIKLTVLDKNFCEASSQIEVLVHDQPSMRLAIEGDCEFGKIEMKDSSNYVSEEVSSRKWYINKEFIGNGSFVTFDARHAGNYLVELHVVTKSGCNWSIQSSHIVHPNPEVIIEDHDGYGVPPSDFLFESGQPASMNYWYLNDIMLSDSTSFYHVFNSEGNYELKLVSESEEGCRDSVIQNILIAQPLMDLEVEEVQLLDENGESFILMSLSNHSNLPVEHFNVEITLEDQFTLSEMVEKRVEVGGRAVIRLGVSLPAQNQLKYLCVSATSQFAVPDIDPSNNESCVNITSTIQIEPAFPNPSTGQTTIRAVFSKQTAVNIVIRDMTGQEQYAKDFGELPQGLNTFKLDMKGLLAGTYFVEIVHDDKKIIRRIIKL